ncbi:uracil-xanthine permease family protein [Aminobacter niigataensis]|uniref:uracil-xanthine permease family protein n=1 Tax=Aminobacter niigataensis TaxID=83265 RepID=UPI0024C94844|nr:solute carrier family 23 protein [Aminobacter niigataensis]CAI2932938.1 Uric acid permease PucK [Aminobacter niigataensis]
MAEYVHAHAGEHDVDQGVVGDVEEIIPAQRRIALGLQQALVSNAWLDPIFIASVAGFSATLATNLVTATFLAAGIVTVVQSTKLVRLPVVQGPSSAFSPLAIGYYKAGTISAASLGLIIGAAFVFILSVLGQFARLRRLLSPAVSGTIITLVGIALAGFTFMEFFGGIGTSNFATGQSIFLACVTTAVVLVSSALGGTFRMFGFLIALIVGDALALGLGQLDFSGVGQAPWIAFPKLLPYGSLTFDPAITITMCIVFVVAVVEAMGMYEATARLTGVELTDRRVNAGIAGEAGGSMLAALIGGFGTTAYAQNLGVIRLTGVASRHVVRVAGFIFIALAFLPKVAAVLVATPAAVVGGLFLPAAATVVMTGIQMASQDRGSAVKNLVAPLGLMAGLGIPALAGALSGGLPQVLAEMLTHSIVVGAVTVFAAEFLLVRVPELLRGR